MAMITRWRMFHEWRMLSAAILEQPVVNHQPLKNLSKAAVVPYNLEMAEKAYNMSAQFAYPIKYNIIYVHTHDIYIYTYK